MDENDRKTGRSEAHDRHHARKRRARRDHAKRDRPNAAGYDPGTSPNLFLYGLHTVRHALENPARKKFRLFATRNGLQRLEYVPGAYPVLEVSEVSPRELDRLVGPDAVHQGVVLETEPLVPAPLKTLDDCDLVVVLDQITDPHNVGAIMRSAVAMGAGAIITTARHSPAQTGVLAKSASGALDLIRHLTVTNLARAIETLHEMGFATIGLDSDADRDFTALPRFSKIAIVLGAEGKGLRLKTRETCQHLARLDMPGPIKSLNVSNAAAISLHECRRLLGN